jgi:hypothetical protein
VAKKAFLTLASIVFVGSLWLSAGAAEKVKFADVAPVADLTAAVDGKIASLQEALADNDSYLKAKKKGIPQDAGTIAVLAQAIAEHSGNSAVKVAAPDLRDAAVKLAKAGDYAAAKAAFEDVKKASKGEGAKAAKPEADWAKLIDMDSLMGEVNSRNARLRKAARKFPDNPAEPVQDAEVLAVLAVAIAADTHDVKDKADLPKWEKFSAELRTGMIKVAADAKAKNVDAMKESFVAAGKSCGSCHNEIRDKDK